MPIFKVTFEDGKQVEVDDNEQYREDLVDTIITRRFENKKTPEGLPVIPISAISFYLIADEKKASAQGRQQKETSEQMTKFVLESTLQANKPPFVLATTLNGGGHYQGLKVLFKDAKNIEIVLVNSIAKLKNMSREEVLQQAENELAIFKNIGFNINKFTYKEHYLQNENHDCGPCTIANLEFEINNPGIDTTATRLDKMEGIILRAQHAYERQFKKEAPAVTTINGKPFIQENGKVTARAKRTATAALASTQEPSMEEKIIQRCKEIIGANDNQARQLAHFTLTKPRDFEDHIAYLIGELTNSNFDVDKLTQRLALPQAKSIVHQARVVVPAAAAAPELSIQEKIALQCKEIMGASDNEAQQLAQATIDKQNRTFEDHMSYLIAEWLNSDSDVGKLVTRLTGSSKYKKR